MEDIPRMHVLPISHSAGWAVLATTNISREAEDKANHKEYFVEYARYCM
jgi:hypothetical protein